jgi:hypothetical protein
MNLGIFFLPSFNFVSTPSCEQLEMAVALKHEVYKNIFIIITFIKRFAVNCNGNE